MKFTTFVTRFSDRLFLYMLGQSTLNLLNAIDPELICRLNQFDLAVDLYLIAGLLTDTDR